MSSFKEINYSCLLCKEVTVHISFKLISNEICPASKKSLKAALQYLARCIKCDLNISESDVLCSSCYRQVLNYDMTMMDILRKQENLCQLIKNACEEIYSDNENECVEHMKILENDFDDIASINDEEINQAIKEAISPQGQKNVKKDFDKSEVEEALQKSRALCIDHVLQCPLCAMRFKNKVRLQKHVFGVHKKFKCDLCEYSHRNEDYVKLHKNIHEGRTEESCVFCHKQFSTKISTIRHMEVHLNEKKYQCDKCGLCFSQTTILYNHKLQHEAEEQPLKCEQCNQLFKTKRTFRHHMITHKPDRPRYCCEYCNKTFTEKYTLKVHRKTHPEAKLELSHYQVTPEVGSTVQIQSTAFVDEVFEL